jgi:hypothetical protein
VILVFPFGIPWFYFKFHNVNLGKVPITAYSPNWAIANGRIICRDILGVLWILPCDCQGRPRMDDPAGTLTRTLHLAYLSPGTVASGRSSGATRSRPSIWATPPRISRFSCINPYCSLELSIEFPSYLWICDQKGERHNPYRGIGRAASPPGGPPC